MSNLLGELLKPFGNCFNGDVNPEEEPIVYLTCRDPESGSRFVKRTIASGVACGLVVSSVIISFLADNWAHSKVCDRPLRWWLLFVALLQLCQSMLNTQVLLDIRIHDASGRSIEACISTIVATAYWRWTKKLGVCMYALLVIGFIWAVNAGDCSRCPGLFTLTCLVLAIYCVRILVTYAYFRLLFPDGVTGSDGSTKLRPASTHEIESLPVSQYCAKTAQDPEMVCAICLSQYSDGEILRKLPCGHEFHVQCCDAWLQRNIRCPLCVQPIDVPPRR